MAKSFRYGENAIDMSSEMSNPEIISGIIPIGTDGESYPIYLDPSRIWYSPAVKIYGRVTKIVNFGQLSTKKISEQTTSSAKDSLKKTLRNTLKSKGQRWMTTVLPKQIDKVSVKGVDNYYLGSSSERIRIGDVVTCYSQPHGINTKSTCLSMEIDYFDHQNDHYVIGPYIPNNYYDPKMTKVLSQ